MPSWDFSGSVLRYVRMNIKHFSLLVCIVIVGFIIGFVMGVSTGYLFFSPKCPSNRYPVMCYGYSQIDGLKVYARNWKGPGNTPKLELCSYGYAETVRKRNLSSMNITLDIIGRCEYFSQDPICEIVIQERCSLLVPPQVLRDGECVKVGLESCKGLSNIPVHHDIYANVTIRYVDEHGTNKTQIAKCRGVIG